MIEVTPNIIIQDDELEFEFIRASGPGGQNVNKVSTAVQLRFDVASSPSLPEEVRQRLLRLGGKRVTTQGVLVIQSQQHRTQEQNREAALHRLVELVRRAAEPPKKRYQTRPTRASQERRLEVKHRRGLVKRLRQSKKELE